MKKSKFSEEQMDFVLRHAGTGARVAEACRKLGITEETKGDFSKEMYNEQVDWETYQLRKAGKTGIIIFWLAKENEHICERAYAQTSRFELGEWKTKHELQKTGLVVGIEPGFTNAKYIMRRFSQDCPDVPICSTLEDTCKKAVELALLKS